MMFSLFFSHQCNTTVTIVAAVLKMIEEGRTSHVSHESLYHDLAAYCLKVQNKPKSTKTDVGAGQHHRFCVSNNELYTETQLKIITTNLLQIFSKATIDHKEIKGNNRHYLKYRLYEDTVNKICCNNQGVFDGLGHFRAGHLVQLSALLGLLPLDFYAYVPLHMNGGPGNFLKGYMNIDQVLPTIEGKNRDEKIIKFTDSEMKRLQFLFNNTYTGNMNENASCIIGRSTHKHDVFYFLPWYDHNTSTLTQQDEHLQLMFYISCPKAYNYVLMAYDGWNSYPIISNSPKINCIMKYNESISGSTPNSGHHLDIDTLDSFFKNT